MKTGLDDGPELPKSAIDAWRDACIARRRQEEGATLRELAEDYGMSPEGIRGRLLKMGIR